MGTFHSGRGLLHGMTVVVDTKGPHVWVGRCDVMDDSRIVLNDADVFEDGRGEESKGDYVRRVARIGYWRRHRRVQIPISEIASVERLGNLSR